MPRRDRRVSLAELQALTEAREKHLAQRDATDRAMLLHRIAVGFVEAAERDQRLHALGQHAKGTRRATAGGGKCLEQRRRQTVVQCSAALRTDMHAVSLQTIGDRAVALIHCGVHPGLLQAVRQAEAADAAADDHHMIEISHDA